MIHRKTNHKKTIGRFTRGATTGLAPVLAAIAGLAIAVPATTAMAQSWDEEHYEWEPGTGYHEEEWYDPSDWFDDDFGSDSGIDYEETDDYGDTDDYGYGYGDTNDYGYGYGDSGYSDWDYYSDEDDPADYDYWDSQYDTDYSSGASGYSDWDSYSDEDDPADYDYWDSRSDFDYTQGNQRQGQDQQRTVKNAQLRGEIDGWQRKSLQGQKDAHTLVRLRLDSGRNAIVNLGPNVELSRLDLAQGDTVAVRGVRGSISGQDVLLAQHVRAGDRTVRMNNWDPSQQSNRGQMQGQRQMQNQGQMQGQMQNQGQGRSQLRGQIDGWQRRSLEGQRDAHTLVRLRMNDGANAIVNLGPNVELSRLDLEQGDQVAVRGLPGKISGKDVLMAQYVQVIDRRTIRMNNWDPSGQTGQRQQQGQPQNRQRNQQGQQNQPQGWDQQVRRN